MRTAVLMAFLLLLAACASPMQLTIEPEPDAGRAARGGYAWVASDVSPGGGWEPEHIERLNRQVHDTLTDALVRRGYREVPRQAADVLVGYRLVVRRVEEAATAASDRERRMERAADAGLQTGGETLPDRREPAGFSGDATLVLSLTDPDGDRLLWRGRAEYELYSEAQSLRYGTRAARRLGAALPDAR